MVCEENVKDWIQILKFNSRIGFLADIYELRLFGSNPYDRGTYQPQKGASLCRLTDPGSYQDKTTSTTAETCPGLKKADFGITRKPELKKC